VERCSCIKNLQKLFEVETNASGYAMGEVLMPEGIHVFYHSGLFHGVFLKYPTYKKELYSLVQAVKKWKHYMIGKEIVIHVDHHLL
jgi:hypothetical protein